MINMASDIALASTCEQTLLALTTTLADRGFRLERSFDLRSALDHQPDCPCPHHGTTQCTCQYVVLLAYDQSIDVAPAAITIHECDGFTRLRVMANQPESRLYPALLAALDEVFNSVLAEA